MSTPSFQERVDELLRGWDVRCREIADLAAQERKIREDRIRRGEETARKIADAVVRPFLAHLVDRLPGGVLRTAHTPGGLQLCFPRNEQFSRSAEVQVRVELDPEAEHLRVHFSAVLIPILQGDPQVPAAGFREWPARNPSADEVASWIGDRLMAFLQAYLKTHRCDDKPARGRA